MLFLDTYITFLDLIVIFGVDFVYNLFRKTDRHVLLFITIGYIIGKVYGIN